MATRGLDLTGIAAALSRPGNDPRQWASFGIVDDETPDARSVIFDDSMGPLVNVTLQPSDIPVVCRVASYVAGQDEGEWFPFLPGDEVQVIVNEGNERAGCVIVGRLYNEIDKWPRTVAGQDATKNIFGFRRLRTPYVIETASSYMVRSALTGASLTIDQTGNLFLVSGDGHKLVMSADAMQFGEASGDTFLQIDMDKKDALIQVGGTAQYIFSNTETVFNTPGSMSITTSGVSNLHHAVTLEQVVGLMLNFAAMIIGNAPTSGLGAIISSPDVLDVMVSAMLLATSTPVPPTVPEPVPFGNYALFPLTFGIYGPDPLTGKPVLLVPGAIDTALANPLPSFDPTGYIMGPGRPGLKF